jgi:hypothetical protein
MDCDPEGWLEQRLKVIALVGYRHPEAVFPAREARHKGVKRKGACRRSRETAGF